MTDEKYRKWHPDHRAYAVLNRSDNLLGTRIWFDEVLEGKFRINLSWEIVEAEYPTCVVFKALVPYPVRLEFHFVENGEQTLIVHTLTIGTRSWFDRMLDPVIERLIFTTARQDLLTRHAREELGNLEQLLR